MTAYNRWIAEATEQLRHHLEEKGLSPESIEDIESLIEGLSLPGLLALLGGSGGTPGRLGPELIRIAAGRVAELPEVRDAGSSAEKIEKVLMQILVQKQRPTELVKDPALRRKVLTRAAPLLLQEAGLTVSPEEGERVAELLESGELFRDVGATTAAVLFTVRGIPIALVDDARNSWRRVILLPFSALRDLTGTPGDALAVVRDLLDGTLDQPPAVLSHTFRALYRLATLRSTLTMIRELIHPRNEAARLAVLLYARANGIQIQPSDLDTLRESVLNPENPSLGPVLVAAWERLEQVEGFESARATLARLGARPA